MNELQVVVKQEVGKINWNFEELKTALATEMKKYTGIVFDDDSIADAKKTVAYLRKLKESVEDRRKDVKKKCLEPYNEMEKQAKELTQLIDEPMLDNGITYEEAAKRIGWTRQNLWYKLNVGVSPTYGTIKKIADGLGFEIRLTQDGKPDITKLEDIAADTEDDSARFIIIEHVINSMGYSLEIVPPEK